MCLNKRRQSKQYSRRKRDRSRRVNVLTKGHAENCNQIDCQKTAEQ